jgi:hypothetical protein
LSLSNKNSGIGSKKDISTSEYRKELNVLSKNTSKAFLIDSPEQLKKNVTIKGDKLSYETYNSYITQINNAINYIKEAGQKNHGQK